jgi:hypothetical protein
MQTFAPEGRLIDLGFQSLDYQRLGKQRVEAWQILNVLRGVDNDGKPKNHKGWVNHPATRMWEGHIAALALYGIRCCEEWKSRGYNDSLLPRFTSVFRDFVRYGDDPSPPAFLDDIMESHRSNLIRKLPEHYQPLWPTTADNLPYVWPVP